MQDTHHHERTPLRVTMEAIEKHIIAEHYFSAYEGRMGSIVEGTYQSMGKGAGSDTDLESLKTMTFCVLVLENGYSVHGACDCLDPAKYNPDIAKTVARQNAIKQIWPLMGYEVKTRAHHQEQMAEGDVLGSALNRMLSHSFGNQGALSAEDTKLILAELIPTNPKSNEQIARVCHEANRSWCELNGDMSQLPWEHAPSWQKDSVINGVIFNRANPDAPESASHDSWMAQKLSEGWTYGPVKDVDAKTHPCLVPFDELPHSQQFKDRLFQTIVRASTRSPLAPSSNHLRLVHG